jgi:hypothetical protein
MGNFSHSENGRPSDFAQYARFHAAQAADSARMRPVDETNRLAVAVRRGTVHAERA